MENIVLASAALADALASEFPEMKCSFNGSFAVLDGVFWAEVVATDSFSVTSWQALVGGSLVYAESLSGVADLEF